MRERERRNKRGKKEKMGVFQKLVWLFFPNPIPGMKERDRETEREREEKREGERKMRKDSSETKQEEQNAGKHMAHPSEDMGAAVCVSWLGKFCP